MKTLILSAALAVVASGAHAASISIDFEDALAEDLSLGTGPVAIADGVTAESTENMQLVQTGEPTSGFVPDDMPVGGSFGEYFLTGDFVDNTDLTLKFAADLKAITFDIADIDGDEPGQGDGTGNDEMFEFIAYLDGSEVSSQTVLSTDVAGDGAIIEIAFSGIGLFDQISIFGTTPNGKRNIGWGIDNIHATAVPLPAAGWLLIGAFGGLAAMKRRKTAA